MWQPKTPVVKPPVLVAQPPSRGNGLRRGAQQDAQPAEAVEFGWGFRVGGFFAPC